MRGASGAPAAVAAAVLACLAAVLLASALGPVTVSGDSPLDRLQLVGDAPEAEAPPAGEEASVEVAEPPEPALGIPLEVVLAMAVTVVAAALLVRAVLQARRPPEEEDEDDAEPGDEVGGAVDLDAVAAAARRGLRRLEQADGAGATDVVVACWVELEVAGGRAGSARAATDTPTEFAARLTAAAPALDPEVLADLRRTYSRARYGSAGASEADVRRARTALAHLLDTLGAGRPATTAAGGGGATARRGS